ncbi:O-antigen ligase family protein [Candidatus Calescamantes bacterium]|nr:O-antigen ligase family protein [Candidatus Calescamantes bacterium]
MKQNGLLENWIKGFLLFSLFLAPLVQLPQAYNYVLIKLSQLQFFLLFSILFLLIKGSLKGEVKFSLHSGYPLLISLFLWYLLSTLFSPYPHASRPYLYTQISYLLLFYLISTMNWDKKEEKFIIGVLLIPFFSLVIKENIFSLRNFLHEIKIAYPQIGIKEIFLYLQTYEKVIPSTFGNPNFFSAYLNILFPMSFLFSLHHLRRKKILIGVPSLIISLLSLSLIYIVRGRAAATGTIAGILTLIIIYRRELLKNKRKIVFSLCLFFIVGGTFSYILPMQNTIKEKFQEDLEKGTLGIRVKIWQGTWRMILARPLVGWGLGTFLIVYPDFRVPEYFLNPHAVNATDHAHNELLEIWSETGIIGLIIFLTLLLLSLREGKKKFDKSGNFIFPALIAGIIGLLGNNLFGVNLRYPSSSIFFFAFLGLLYALPPHNKERFLSLKLSLSTRYKTLLLILFSIAGGWIFFNVGVKENISQIHLRKGIILRKKLIWDKAIPEYLKSLAWNPYNLRARYRLAFAYASTNNLEEAINEYLKIKELAPHYAEVDFNLGALYLRKGEIIKAGFYLEEMLRLNPYQAATHANMALIYRKIGKIEESIMEFKKAISLNPSLLPAYWDLARLLQEKGRFREALNVLEELVKRDTENVKIRETIKLLKKKIGEVNGK